MKVSFNQRESPSIKDNNGFGYAARMCKESLVELGHGVSWRDPDADVEMCFIQPQHFFWSGPYRIGYVPWESTTLPDGWVKSLNECDEVWTPSPVIAQWFVDAGVKRDVKVYEHGVDPIWTPHKRSPMSGRYRAFHHGAEGVRKGGELALAAFQNVLWDEYATLVFKMVLSNFMVNPNSLRVEAVPGRLSVEELVKLYHSVNLMIYPSWGEGFGLTPLQAMATGMPVLITDGWAPYQDMLPDTSIIKSTLVDSPWQEHHPGKMFQPDFGDLVDKLRYQWENRERLTQEAYDLSHEVHKRYNWVDLTEKAFAHLV